jgi:hypothetical protein
MARCVVIVRRAVVHGGIGPMDGLRHLGEHTHEFVTTEAGWECGVRAEHPPIASRTGWPDEEHRAPAAVGAIDEVAIDAEAVDIDDQRGVGAVSVEAGQRLLDAHARDEFDRERAGGGPPLQLAEPRGPGVRKREHDEAVVHGAGSFAHVDAPLTGELPLVSVTSPVRCACTTAMTSLSVASERRTS